MLKSVNQSCGISPKFRDRYGSTWADLDFIFKDKVYAKSFKEDPLHTRVGTLEVAGLQIPFTYKDLMQNSRTISKIGAETHREDLSKKFEINIKSKSILLNRQEINRLSETLSDALLTVDRSYELGLYL
jgi:hypothetical protein|tara:strand:- start:1262 stop:1648 length:387 start_codon:yes stop_codon:yes gene_type:complete